MKQLQKLLFAHTPDNYLTLRLILGSFSLLVALAAYFKTRASGDIWLSISFVWFISVSSSLIELFFGKKKKMIVFMQIFRLIGLIIGIAWIIYNFVNK